jgi:REP element-mobilizing transposase RayT
MLQMNQIMGDIMWNKKLALYLHLIWSTWDRTPWLTSNIENQIYRNIVSQVHILGCKVLTINGMPDHIHLVVYFPTTITVANLVKKAKGVSSRFINQRLILDELFKWQVGYGAFTISRWDLHRIINYVKNQKKHHASGDLERDLENIFNK